MKSDAGFTLVEVLVALAISAMLMATLGTALKVVSDGSARSSRLIDRLDMMSRGLAAVQHDLSGMERAVIIEQGNPRLLFEGSSNHVQFVSIEPAQPTHPGSYLISYSVRQQGTVGQLVRSRSIFEYQPPTRDAGPSESDEVVVLEGAYRYAFSFEDQATGQWLEQWTDASALPSLIRLDVTSTDPRVPSMPSLIAHPKVDAELSCLISASAPCTPRTGVLKADTSKLQQNAPPLVNED
ncbi:MAG: prepilin-type N-terminal cleavage/methylation domain-containing protein [Hyphomicrobium sp.]|jgi:general secretion pathway protein J